MNEPEIWSQRLLASVQTLQWMRL